MAEELTVRIGQFDPTVVQSALDRSKACLDALRGAEIQTDQDLEAANAALVSVCKEKDALKAAKDTVLKPLNAGVKGFRDLFRPSEDMVELLEKTLKAMIGSYQLHQAKKYEQLYASATAQANAGAATAQAAVVQALQAAPAKLQGTSVRMHWKATVINAGLVPPAFCTPDLVAIQAHASATPAGQDPEPIPGVKFTQEPIVTVRR